MEQAAAALHLTSQVCTRIAAPRVLELSVAQYGCLQVFF